MKPWGNSQFQVLFPWLLVVESRGLVIILTAGRKAMQLKGQGI